MKIDSSPRFLRFCITTRYLEPSIPEPSDNSNHVSLFPLHRRTLQFCPKFLNFRFLYQFPCTLEAQQIGLLLFKSLAPLSQPIRSVNPVHPPIVPHSHTVALPFRSGLKKQFELRVGNHHIRRAQIAACIA